MKTSKYARLDRCIVRAVAAGARSHRRIYTERHVWRALGKVLSGTWGTGAALLSRRLQHLAGVGVIRCGAWNRWQIV
jgi:hypothetical protein